MTLPAEKRRVILGYTGTVFVLAGFCASTVAAQALETKIPDFQLSFIRFAGQFVLSLIIFLLQGDSLKGLDEDVPRILGISVTGIIYTVFFFHGVAILPLTDSYAFFSLVATVTLALLTRFHQHTDLGLFHNLSIAIGALGCLFIVQPWQSFSAGFVPAFLKHNQNTPSTTLQPIASLNSSSESPGNALADRINAVWIAGLGYLFIALAGINESVSLMLVGSLKNTKPISLSVVISFLCCFPSLLLSFFMEQPVLISDPKLIAFATLHSVGASVGSVGLCYACIYIAPSRVSIVQSFSIILLLIAQYTVMRNGLFGRMNVLEVLGCLIITLSLMVSLISSFTQKTDSDLEK